MTPHLSRFGRRLLAVGLSVAALVAGSQRGRPGRGGGAGPVRLRALQRRRVVGSGTTPAGTTVGVVGTGQYKITFVGAAAAGGVVHVTAINSAPHWCQVNGFGPSGADEVVSISCYRVGGAPDFTGFSAIFSSSSGPASALGAFGYVNSMPSGALVSQYNSAGPGNTVTHTATRASGRVKFPGLSTPRPDRRQPAGDRGQPADGAGPLQGAVLVVRRRRPGRPGELLQRRRRAGRHPVHADLPVPALAVRRRDPAQVLRLPVEPAGRRPAHPPTTTAFSARARTPSARAPCRW